MVETPQKYPSIPDIVDAMVEVFNAEAVGAGRYSLHELRIHPITREDIYEREHEFVMILFQCNDWKPDTWHVKKASRRVMEEYDDGTPLWYWCDESGDIIDDDDNLITHWMLLPKPPKP